MEYTTNGGQLAGFVVVAVIGLWVGLWESIHSLFFLKIDFNDDRTIRPNIYLHSGFIMYIYNYTQCDFIFFIITLVLGGLAEYSRLYRYR